MADTKKKVKYVNFMSPVGIAIFPKLTKADYKFDDKGVYECKLAIAADEAEPFITFLQPHLDAAEKQIRAEMNPKDAKKKAKYATAPFFNPELDDDGNETGRLVFKFKKPASYIDKKDGDKVKPISRPRLFDAMNRDVTETVGDVWGGSKLIVAGHIRPYISDAGKSIGITLRLDAAQILELRQGGDKSAEQYGFGKREGGFTGGDNAPPPIAADDAADAASSDDSDSAAGDTEEF